MSLTEWIPTIRDTAAVDQFYTGSLTQLASTALLFYDHLLTLTDEIGIMWRSPVNLATVLYMIIRYGALIDTALYSLNDAPERLYQPDSLWGKRCQALADTATVLHIVWMVAVSAFVAIRIMALWSRNWYLGIFLFVAGLVNSTPIVQIVYMGWFHSIPVPWPLPGCAQDIDDDVLVEVVSFYVPVVTSSVNMAYELLCLVLTLVKTLRAYQHTRFNVGTKANLSGFLLRYGAVYFIVMCLLSIFNILSATIPSSSFAGFNLNSAFTRSLVPMLTTRFIVDLHRAAGADTGTMSDSHAASSTLVFRSRTERLFSPISGPHVFSEDESESHGFPLEAWPEGQVTSRSPPAEPREDAPPDVGAGLANSDGPGRGEASAVV